MAGNNIQENHYNEVNWYELNDLGSIRGKDRNISFRQRVHTGSSPDSSSYTTRNRNSLFGGKAGII